jgi:hypothetical protein
MPATVIAAAVVTPAITAVVTKVLVHSNLLDWLLFVSKTSSSRREFDAANTGPMAYPIRVLETSIFETE